jgi:hypothetical protein
MRRARDQLTAVVAVVESRRIMATDGQMAYLRGVLAALAALTAVPVLRSEDSCT